MSSLSSFSVNAVITYDQGTVVDLSKDVMPPRITFGKGGHGMIMGRKQEVVWFYDRNDSGILDTGDLKIRYDRYEVEPVSEADINAVGKRVSHLFEKAKNERAQMASFARKYMGAPQKSIWEINLKSSELPEELRGLLKDHVMRKSKTKEGGKRISITTKANDQVIHLILAGKTNLNLSFEQLLGLTNNANMIDAVFYPLTRQKRISFVEGIQWFFSSLILLKGNYKHLHIDLIPE